MSFDKVRFNEELNTKIAALEGNIDLMLRALEELEGVYNQILQNTHCFSSAARLGRILAIIGEEIDAQDRASSRATQELERLRLLKKWLDARDDVDVDAIFDAAAISALCG